MLPDLSERERLLVAATWNFRASAERSALRRFTRLRDALAQTGTPEPIVALMEQAVDDEARHIGLCDQVAKDYGWPGDPSPPTPYGPLGPQEASDEDRLLYEMVAFCCVTETLNTSMLLAIHRRVVAPDIKAQVHAILKDEVNHSRVGWAYLQYRYEQGDIAQLTNWLPNMFHGAGVDEVYAPDSDGRDTERMADYGELGLTMRTQIFEAAVRDVIFPGLERVGVDTRPSQLWLETFQPVSGEADTA